ncbi:MAG: FHIPEP family type III secretion protein [Candidatus Gastranaerophilales bacterium]|nr:FHIPEP family type III secretion protein [Candidatus Gastranaerophilales bacterium]
MNNMIEKLKQIFKIKKEETQPTVEDRIEEAFNSLGDDVVRIEIGSDITEVAGSVLEKISEFREDIKSKTGFIFPPVRVLEKDSLQENELVFYIRGKDAFHEFAIPNKEYVDKNIYDCLQKVFDDYLEDVFTMEYVEKYINKVQAINSWLVWDVSKQLGAYEIKTILVNIIKEKKSISDIHLIFEKIDECLSENRDWCHVWKPDVVSKRICKEI